MFYLALLIGVMDITYDFQDSTLGHHVLAAKKWILKAFSFFSQEFRTIPELVFLALFGVSVKLPSAQSNFVYYQGF